MTNTNTKKDSFQEGLTDHVGKLNRALNMRILSLCKAFPLSCYLYSKTFLINQGAGDLYHLKQRVFRSMAENVVRFYVLSVTLFIASYLMSVLYLIVGVCLFLM